MSTSELNKFSNPNTLMDIEAEVRSRLNEICQERYGGNETEMARSTGITRPTLHNILSGKTKKIELKQIVAVVAKTGVSLDWLILNQGPRLKTEQALSSERLSESGRTPNVRVPELMRFDKPKGGPVGDPEGSVEPRGVPGPPKAVLPGIAIRVAGQPSVFMDWCISGREERISVDLPFDIIGGRVGGAE